MDVTEDDDVSLSAGRRGNDGADWIGVPAARSLGGIPEWTLWRR